MFSQINVTWTKKFSAGTDTYNYATHLLVPNLNSIYVVGHSKDNGIYSLVLIKYDSEGNQQWNTFYTHGSDTRHIIRRFYIEDNMIHVLTSYNSSSVFLIKFSLSGEFIEEIPLISGISFVRILVKDGDIYTTEALYPWGAEYPEMVDTKVSKYDSSGSLLWSHTYNFTQTTGFRFDNEGNLLLMGRNDLTYYTNANGVEGDVKTDVFILKLNTDGTELWVRSFSLEEDSFENLWGAALDEDNNAYFVYTNINYLSYILPRIYKISSDGELIWSQVFTHPEYGNPSLYRGIQYNNSKIYLSGKSEIPSQPNLLTLSLDLEGSLEWYSNLLTHPNYSGQEMFLRFDNNNNVYNFGYKSNYSTRSDIYIHAISPNGVVLDDLAFNSTGSAKESIYNAVTYLNNIYVLAQSNSEIMLLKISNEYASAVAEFNNTNVSVFPNPFKGELTINISEKNISKETKVKIIDMLGKSVFEKELSKNKSQIHPSLKQGVYVIQISTNQKLIYQDKLLVKI